MSETKKSSRGMAGILDVIDGVIAKLEEFIMATGVILMAVNTIANVISRFIFNHSIIFAEELNSVFILLVTFAGVGYAARHGRHIRMSAIYDSLSDRKRKLMMILITAVTAVCMLFLAYFSVTYIIDLQSKGRVDARPRRSGLPGVPVGANRIFCHRNPVCVDDGEEHS